MVQGTGAALNHQGKFIGKQLLDLQTRGSFPAIVTHLVPEFLPSYATLTLVAFLNILDPWQ